MPSTNDDPSNPNAANRTPKELADEIRAYAAEVFRRVEEWRSAPDWLDDERNRRRYAITAGAIAALDQVPDPQQVDELGPIVAAVQPILDEWQPSWAGPQQAIYAAVDRLRRIVVAALNTTK
jgi:hypothetical protein